MDRFSAALYMSALDWYVWQESVEVLVSGAATPKKGSLYVRTAYRNDADFSMTNIRLHSHYLVSITSINQN